MESLEQTIKNASYLTEEDKQQWLQKLPSLNDEQRQKLAELLQWAEQQRAHLENQKKEILTTLKRIFIAMDSRANKIAKKETLRTLEAREENAEEIDENQLLNDLHNA